jgi:hypothetical protein
MQQREPLNRFSCRYANPYQGFQKFSKFIIAIKPQKWFQMFLLYTLIHADAGEIIFPGLVNYEGVIRPLMSKNALMS